MAFFSISSLTSLLLMVTVTCAAETAALSKVTGVSGSGQSVTTDTHFESVLERFRTYAGPRNPDELSNLFTPPAGSNVRQQPPIALSDGRSAVVIAARIPAQDGRAINFSLEGATQVSVRKLKTDEWEINAIPDKGAVAMSLFVMNDNGSVKYPLIAAPPLPGDTDLSEQGFTIWLNQGDSDAASHDLNHDGRHDYMDDYIFTANYLAQQSTTGNSHEARRLRALKRTLSAPNSVAPQSLPKDVYDGFFYGEP
jgi:hypothetical protein